MGCVSVFKTNSSRKRKQPVPISEADVGGGGVLNSALLAGVVHPEKPHQSFYRNTWCSRMSEGEERNMC